MMNALLLDIFTHNLVNNIYKANNYTKSLWSIQPCKQLEACNNHIQPCNNFSQPCNDLVQDCMTL